MIYSKQLRTPRYIPVGIALHAGGAEAALMFRVCAISLASISLPIVALSSVSL
jgi:hypothetical protein